MTTPVPDPVTGSPKFKLNKSDVKPIMKSWGLGALLSVVAFTGTFVMSEIDWGPLAAMIAVIVPPAITTVTRWLSDLRAK